MSVVDAMVNEAGSWIGLRGGKRDEEERQRGEALDDSEGSALAADDRRSRILISR